MMEKFDNIAPWISAGVLFAIVLFFTIFYIIRFFQFRKEIRLHRGSGSDLTLNITNEQKKKIVNDFVAGITPAIGKQLEKSLQ